ncbi:MAG: DUF1573 domain-containing protein [Patescibacteria group bacterium]|nr:DUF1573 domain-containing protein [Patescibacteria group bacterium]
MNRKFVMIGVLMIVGLRFGWYSINSNNNNDSVDTKVNQNSNIALISPQVFAELAQNEQAFILDVHSPEQTHIPGTDAFIPYDQIKKNLDQLPTDKTTPILVYCRSGGMSAGVAQELATLGYTHIYDLQGGVNAYRESRVSVALTPNTRPLGTVIYGDVATTTFTLTNFTPLPTKITRVSTSCGCTQASVEKEELGAYESTTVNVSFDPAVHQDDSDLGDLTRTIYIETNNPNFPELESTITATVIKK